MIFNVFDAFSMKNEDFENTVKGYKVHKHSKVHDHILMYVPNR